MTQPLWFLLTILTFLAAAKAGEVNVTFEIPYQTVNSTETIYFEQSGDRMYWSSDFTATNTYSVQKTCTISHSWSPSGEASAFTIIIPANGQFQASVTAQKRVANPIPSPPVYNFFCDGHVGETWVGGTTGVFLYTAPGGGGNLP